jgi:prepilin-type N-terminal cleavage/methylation domain-containing protein
MHRGNLTSSGGRRHDGFTLVEVLVAGAIVGILFVALLQSFTVGLSMLDQSQRMTVATSLAENIHEMMLTLPLVDPGQPAHWGPAAGQVNPPFICVNNYDGVAFSPPVAADGTRLTSLSIYTQKVTVAAVSPTNFNQVLADGASNVYRVSVTITCQGQTVCSLSWLCLGGG